MAQGPTGAGAFRGAPVELSGGMLTRAPPFPARAFGPKAQYGGGVAVMNAARSGGGGGGGGGGSGGRGQWDDSPMDPDASDLEEEDDEDQGFKIRARELNDIGDEDEMAPLVLPRDPKVVRSATERKKERAEARIKNESESFSLDIVSGWDSNTDNGPTFPPSTLHQTGARGWHLDARPLRLVHERHSRA